MRCNEFCGLNHPGSMISEASVLDMCAVSRELTNSVNFAASSSAT